MARQLTAVLYVRVSYRKQVEGTSLDTQERVCREWCAARGYEVAAVFTDAGESAKTADRPEFQRMLAYVRKHKAKIGHIVVYRFDRFARNIRDDVNVRAELADLKVLLHSTQEAVDNTPFGEAARMMAAVFAQTDNAIRAERAVSGMRARVANGRWCWKAPLGYVCTGRRGKDVSLTPDPATAPLIAELFALISSGHHRPHDALAQMTARGLKSQRGKAISLGTLLQMLRCPVYCGRLEIPE